LLIATYILAAALLASSAARAGDLTFQVQAPPGCESSTPLRLLLKDVELPRSRAVTIRAYAKQSGREEESFIGLFAVMADSVNAPGIARCRKLE
jgi:hypothetical protein